MWNKLKTKSETLGTSTSLASDPDIADRKRRSLLGGVTTGGLVAATSIGVLATLRSERAEASLGAAGWYDAKADFGAVGNGIADDTLSLQTAINAASGMRPLYLPPGTYKITSPLIIPRYVKLFGSGRTLAATIAPQGCGLFIIDGSLYSGGWVMGISISELAADLTLATSSTAAVYIHQAYNIVIRDCFFNNSGANVACNTLIQDCNDVVLDNTSICGYYNTISSNPLGLSIVGTAGGAAACTVKLIAADCEYFDIAMKTSGNATVDMFSPYVESSLTNYYHGIASGQVNIFGGIMEGGQGAAYIVNIQGDNLAIHGTQMLQGRASAAILNVATSPTFKNVKVYGSINWATNSGILPADANLASIDFYPPRIANVNRGTIDFTKMLTSGAATALLTLSTTDVMKCRLGIYAHIGAGSACVSAQFDFVLGSDGLIPNIVSSAGSTLSNSNWAITLSAPMLSASGSTYTFTITATSAGLLGAGQMVALFGSLEYASYDAGAANSIVAL
ncbi:MAG: glycosyl hydrolase family 28-related protein [Steroidobacter sp.]